MSLEKPPPLNSVTEDDAGSFTYVDRKKNKKSRRNNSNNAKRKQKELSAVPGSSSFENSLKKSAGVLDSCGWRDTCIDALEGFLDEELSSPLKPKPERALRLCLCLGLGSPSASAASRSQLQTLIWLCSHLGISHADTTLFDPEFITADREGLAALLFNVETENKAGKHSLAPLALLFMPHCDLDLHENVFRHNWDKERLEGVLIIANDLMMYADSLPSRKFRTSAPCTARLIPYLKSRRLPQCSALPEAFNDMALQFIPPGTLPPKEDESFWNWKVSPPLP